MYPSTIIDIQKAIREINTEKAPGFGSNPIEILLKGV